MWAEDQPTVKKTLSTGAELAGTAKILSKGAQIPSGYIK